MRVLLGMILTVGLIALACSSEATQAPATEPVAPAATVMPPTPVPTDAPMLEPTATLEPEPTATWEPTATPIVVESIELSGEGTKTERVTLVEGLRIVDASVTNNQDCSFGSCSADNFIVTIESTEGTGYDIIANEIGEDWSGSTTLRVGGIIGLAPGRQIVSVDSQGAWAIRFTLG